ncbi:hypothetical protein L195_g048182, partial [Trifolium pratense]
KRKRVFAFSSISNISPCCRRPPSPSSTSQIFGHSIAVSQPDTVQQPILATVYTPTNNLSTSPHSPKLKIEPIQRSE